MNMLELKCANFYGNMTSGLLSFLESQEMTNVTIAVEGKHLNAHQMILSICSTYFKSLLLANTCQHPIIFMKDVKYQIMKDLLHFMYEGQVQVQAEDFQTFIDTARALEIKWLTDFNDRNIVEPNTYLESHQKHQTQTSSTNSRNVTNRLSPRCTMNDQTGTPNVPQYVVLNNDNGSKHHSGGSTSREETRFLSDPLDELVELNELEVTPQFVKIEPQDNCMADYNDDDKLLQQLSEPYREEPNTHDKCVLGRSGMNPFIFKVWDVSRKKKYFVTVEYETNSKFDLHQKLISKASLKLQINGASIVQESDGTPIESSAVLKMLNPDIVLLLLQPGERWKSTDSIGTSSTIPAGSSMEDLDNHSVSEENLDMESTWSNYAIPWARLSPKYLTKLKNGEKDKEAICSLIRIIIDDLRLIKEQVPAKILKQVAKNVVECYPLVFKDVDTDGVVIGDGWHSTYDKLQTRISYLHRNKKRNNSGDDGYAVPEAPAKRKTLSERAGCANWSPTANDVENKELTETIRLQLTTQGVEATKDFDSLMSGTYWDQRQDINARKSVQEICEKWPILTKKAGIYWHFNKLMNISLDNIEIKCYEKYNLFEKFATDKKILNEARSFESNKMFTILRIITIHLKENFKCILVETEQKNIDLETIPRTPIIVHRKNDECNDYSIYIDKVFFGHSQIFEDAFSQMFGLYYIFNLDYAKELSCTLEMVQRFLLKIHPAQGTKNSKISTSSVKVFNFIRALKKFA